MILLTPTEPSYCVGVAVGVSGGQVITYDIRSSKPLLIKDHNYDLPINTTSRRRWQ